MDPKLFEEQIFFLTVRIVATDGTTGKGSLGTSFIVVHPIQQLQERMVVVLVTCRHVLLGGSGRVTLIFNRREEIGSLNANLGQKIQLGPASYNEAYYAHDDPEVDLAAVNLSSVIDNNPLIYFRSLCESDWADFNNEKLIPTKDVIFIGYPEGWIDQRNNLPIARIGKIASHPRVDFNGKPEFLIDAQVFKGSSGSPVFVLLENVYRFCGVVGRSASREIPVKTFGAPTKQVVEDFIGLGVVYKPEAVLDLVKKVADSQAKSSANP